MTNIEKAYAKAVDVLRACSKKTGFYASGLKGGYEATWARDSMITGIGASLAGNEFKTPFKKSLELLAKNQSFLGQIPNAVGTYNTDRRSDVTFNSIDSSLWFVIGLIVYTYRYDDTALFNKLKKNLTLALIWLSYQDPDEVKVLAQQPTMDWMDAFPHKYGYVLNTQALYYAVLKMVGKDRQAKHMRRVINGEIEKYISLYDKKLGYYYPWGWKNHDTIREHEEWFDGLGNSLAILTGLATTTIGNNIVKHVEKKKINKPYPLKAIFPPIKRGDPEWHDYFDICDARDPYRYLNAGVWPFVGGFYIAALVKLKKYKQAEAELANLAKANLQELDGHEFNEWLHGKTGKPEGEPYQAWSAAAYIYAYHCVKAKEPLYFEY